MPEKGQIRIHKLLAGWGIASRRSIEAMVEEGRITVDGEVINRRGLLVDEENPPVIAIDGKIIKPSPQKNLIYMLNKPLNVVCTLKDRFNRKTIADLIPKDVRLYSIGRLDADSTGLLLITNMGELTKRLLHPSFKVEKEYIVGAEGQELSEAELKQFASGLNILGRVTLPCSIKKLEGKNIYSVVMKEGRNRQIRRMFEFLGRRVTSLKRVRFGPLSLGALEAGQIRKLRPTEASLLLKAVGLQKGLPI